MSIVRNFADPVRSTVIVVVILFDVALLPIFANVIAVLSPEGGKRSFQIALLAVAILAVLLRWMFSIGMTINILLVLGGVLALFWSSEPFAYAAYTGYLTLALGVLLVLVYVLSRQRRRNDDSGT